MKICGLTGGVGMGKSTAAGFLLQLGAKVVDTDDLARELVQPGQPALAEIKNAFGGQIMAPDGSLKRADLAKIVFADEAARKKLEGILHPKIRDAWLARVEAWREDGCAVAVVVIPLLFETGAESQFDSIICVASSAQTQRERLLARGWLDQEIDRRIASQMPVDQKIAKSNFVIWSEGSKAAHQQQVGAVFRRL